MRARARPRTGSATATAVRAGDEPWSFRELDELQQRLRPPPRRRGVGRRRPGGGHDDEPRRVRRRGRTASARLGAAAVLLSPAWKAVEVGHAARLTGAGATPSPTAPPWRCSAERLGADRVTDLDDADGDASRLARRPSRLVVDGDDRRATSRCSCSARARPGCPRRCATRTARSGTARATGCDALGLGPDDRFQVATPPSHILGLLNLLAAADAGATVRLHRAVRPRRGAAPHRVRPHDPRDGGGADRAGDGQPPRASRTTTSRRSATSCGAPRR